MRLFFNALRVVACLNHVTTCCVSRDLQSEVCFCSPHHAVCGWASLSVPLDCWLSLSDGQCQKKLSGKSTRRLLARRWHYVWLPRFVSCARRLAALLTAPMLQWNKSRWSQFRWTHTCLFLISSPCFSEGFATLQHHQWKGFGAWKLIGSSVEKSLFVWKIYIYNKKIKIKGKMA